MARNDSPEQRLAARTEGYRVVLQGHGIDTSLASSLALRQRRELAGALPGANDDVIADLEDAHDEAERREGFLMRAIKFPFRHPIVTGIAALGGVAGVGYATGRLGGWIESILQRVGVRAVNATTRTIAPLGGTEGINPGGTVPGGLNTPI